MKIIINEVQEPLAMQGTLERIMEESMPMQEEGQKRLMVKDFLDKNFVKANIASPTYGSIPKNQSIVVMVDTNKNPIKSLSDIQLFYLLQEQFKNILPIRQRDVFLKQTIIAWYNNKITRNGNLTT